MWVGRKLHHDRLPEKLDQIPSLIGEEFGVFEFGIMVMVELVLCLTQDVVHTQGLQCQVILHKIRKLEIFLAGRPTLLMPCLESNLVNMAAGHKHDGRKVNDAGLFMQPSSPCLMSEGIFFWLYLLFLNRDIKNSN
jgi:hypothetical protein